MTLPTALVTVDLLAIEGLAALISGATRPYAIATIGERFFGKSRAIPSGAADLDLKAEPMPWSLTVPTFGGAAVVVVVAIYDDLGDKGATELGRLQQGIPWPYVSGPVTLAGSPTVNCKVTSRLLPKSVRVVSPRVPVGSKVKATIAVPNTLLVEFTDIRGLYQPGFVPANAASPKRSEPSPGYRSEDEKGRIFLNRDLDGKYARDTQSIELAVKVTRVRGALPGDAKIKWTLAVPDDPFDGNREVHQQWAPYIDAKDYDAAGVPTGASAGDNEGKPDKSPAWEAVSGFGISGVSDVEAKTDIVSGESKVTLHCPNVAGDNLIVTATIESATKIEVFEAATGIMTMWHRVDLEYIKMASALDLPVDLVPPYFEQACAELNVMEKTDVPDQRFLAPKLTSGFSDACTDYVKSHAKHIGDPGWFFVVAAMEPYPLPASPGGTIFTGTVTLKTGGSGAGKGEFIDIPGSHADASYAEFEWSGNKVGFLVDSATPSTSGPPWTRVWLQPHDVQDQFTAGDGSHAHAYATTLDFYPRGKLDGATWTTPGYGMPDKVHVTIARPGAFYVAGISPGITVAGTKYFGGRTLIFTHHGGFFKNGKARGTFHDESLAAMAHELVHAFGMPHKCGYFDYRTPREFTCHMNYGPNWMLDANRDLVAGTSEKIGKDMCGRHLKEVRRVHLEENKGLASLGW